MAMTALVTTLAGSSAAAAEVRTIWDGAYGAAQAARGEEAFRACTYCHGRDLKGGDDPPGPAIKGAIFLARWSGKTLGDLFQRIVDTMPKNDPGSLSDDTYADILSYMLLANGAPAGSKDLRPDVDALSAIVLTENPRATAR
jgi:hypothetical protein